MRSENFVTFLVIFLAVVLCGCATVQRVLDWWDEKQDKPAVITDDVAWSDLGHFFAGWSLGAEPPITCEQIDVSISGNMLTYTMGENTAWKPNEGALCCIYFKRDDGQWVDVKFRDGKEWQGGKYDWAVKADDVNYWTANAKPPYSGKPRPLDHISPENGYCGGGVGRGFSIPLKSGTEFVHVIVHDQGRERSNIKRGVVK